MACKTCSREAIWLRLQPPGHFNPPPTPRPVTAISPETTGSTSTGMTGPMMPQLKYKNMRLLLPNLTIAEAHLLALQGMFEMMPPEDRETIVKRVLENVNFIQCPHTGVWLLAIFVVLRSSWLHPNDLLTRTAPPHHADAKCWWCNYKTQTREHLFKNCPQWKSQQKALWAVVREEKSAGQRHGRLGGG